MGKILLARLAVFAVTTALTTAVPFIVQDRPVLKIVWDKVGPRVVDRVKDRVDDKLTEEQQSGPTYREFDPVQYHDGITVTGAQIGLREGNHEQTGVRKSGLDGS